jgi:hypothetical protein
LSRDGTSVDIELVEEGGQELVSTSFGKPEVQVRESGGTLNPRVIDQWSGLENFTLVGKLFDYAASHDLADLVKSASTSPLEVSIPSDVYPDSVTVAPAAGQEAALSLAYASGRKNQVDVSLSLTRVGSVTGVGDQSAVTPRASGSGPVEVRAGGSTIELPTADLSLERSVGRPNDVVRRQPGKSDPRYEVKRKVTSDVFTFSFETVGDVVSTLNSLTDAVFRERLGRTGVVLDFNGVLGLGEVRAIPVGSSPFRQVHSAGQRWVSSPTLEFRRVFDASG